MNYENEINSILNGELKSFETLIERFQRPVYKFLIGMGVPKNQVEDLAQDVFLAVYQHLNSYDSTQSLFSTWIFSIAKNKAINFMRVKKVKSFFGFTNENLEFQKNDSDLNQRIQNRDQQRLIQAALATCTIAQRSVFVLFYYGELSLEEIAVLEKCSVGTVKSRLSRMKSEMKSMLDQEVL